MRKSIAYLQETIGYQFKNSALLEQALTHKSVLALHNERLEFLGDAILNFVIADLLYQHFPKAKEGELTRRRANLVNGRALYEKAKLFELGEYLHLGTGEKLSGGFRRQSILANGFEALLGALYLDAGYSSVREKIASWFKSDIESESKSAPEKDAKTLLQEWLQGHQRPLPTYEVIHVEGPQHEQVFTVQLTADTIECPIIAVGNSRRIAEQRAAKKFLEVIHASK